MGLSNDWAAKMLRLVGNYGEIYERNLGTDSKLGIPARHEPALEPRRHPVRAADPLASNDQPYRLVHQPSNLPGKTATDIVQVFRGSSVFALQIPAENPYMTVPPHTLARGGAAR